MSPEKTKLVTEITEKSPILLRRLTLMPIAPDVYSNMTIVSTQGGNPEMGDQQPDATAPRND